MSCITLTVVSKYNDNYNLNHKNTTVEVESWTVGIHTALESTSLWTATLLIPCRRQELITRQAISPRLAIRTLSNCWKSKQFKEENILFSIDLFISLCPKNFSVIGQNRIFAIILTSACSNKYTGILTSLIFFLLYRDFGFMAKGTDCYKLLNKPIIRQFLVNI